MSPATTLRDDLDDLVSLAVALGRYADRSDAVRDMLQRLHHTIRSTHAKVMMEGSETLAYAVANFEGVR